MNKQLSTNRASKARRQAPRPSANFSFLRSEKQLLSPARCEKDILFLLTEMNS